MIKYSQIYIKLILLIFFIAFSFTAVLHDQYKIDEYNHHIPTLKHVEASNFIEGIKGEGYKSANTPLPYYIGSLLANLINQPVSLRFARIINIATTILFLFFLYKYLIRFNMSAYLILIIIFFYPYVLKTSFTYYQAIYGLLFFVLYLLYFEKDDLKSWFLSGLFMVLAILSQQFYLVLIPAKPLYHIFQKYKKSNSLRTILTTESLLLNSAFHFLLLPFVIFFFYSWSGLTHPAYQRHAVTISPTNITGILTIIGLTFSPLLIFTHKNFITKKRFVYFLLSSIVLTLFFTPEWSQGSDPGKISGYTFHSLAIAERFIPPLKYFLQIVLMIIGSETLYRIFKRKFDLFHVLTVLFMIGFLINAVLSERHMLPLIVIMYIALLKELSYKHLLVWSAIQIIGGVIYFYYLFAFNNY